MGLGPINAAIEIAEDGAVQLRLVLNDHFVSLTLHGSPALDAPAERFDRRLSTGESKNSG